MRLALVLLAAVVLVGATVAAIRTECALSIQTALQAALDNGFDAVIWEPTPEMERQAKKFGDLAGEKLVIAGAGQVVIPRGHQITDVEQPLLVIWYPTAGRAVKRIEADRPLIEGRLGCNDGSPDSGTLDVIHDPSCAVAYGSTVYASWDAFASANPTYRIATDALTFVIVDQPGVFDVSNVRLGKGPAKS